MLENTLFMIAIMLIVAATCQWVAWRVKIPGIVFLLVSGIIAGPVLGFLIPEKLLGDLFFPFVSISVALILFEGSLTLNFAEIKGLETVVRNLVSFGMVITWIITAIAAKYAVGLSWEMSVLFGAITSVSGPTVIVPMLRAVRPKRKIADILRWEGIIIDPIGAAMAVLVYEFIISGSGRHVFGHTVLIFVKLVLTGTLVGISAGYLFGLSIRHHWIPEFLHNLCALSMVIVSFVFLNYLQHESGLVTVTVMGIWLANMKNVPIEDILDFKEHISILLISILFIMLAARLDIRGLIHLGWGVGFLFLAVQFFARPLNVMASCIGSTLSWPERHLLAWIAPRGIVAAAVSAFFSVQLEKAGFADAPFLVPLTFFIIISTVVLQSLTARPIAHLLKVADPEPNGFLIIGANVVARTIAKALMDQDVRVLLADTGWDHISKARIEGLPCYFGNPLSEHAERHIDLVGIRGVLALSPHESINAAAGMHFKMELGSDNIYIISSRTKNSDAANERLSIQRQGHGLFGKNVTFSYLASILSRGGEIITTKLTDEFSYDTFLEKHPSSALSLFAVDPEKRLHVFSDDKSIKPGTGWLLIYLLIQK